jgi:pSer/pThr/pTyr-binding forkhead associated (FHA) protein
MVSTRDLARARNDELAFVAAHPAPALLLPEVRAGSRAAATQTLTGEDESAVVKALDVRSAQVAFLLKSDRNPFAMMITVGRANNNDVVLPDRTVSKFHASFRKSPTGWILTDQRSANGTFVDGKRLEQGESVLLADEATVRFGKTFTTRFVTPKRLFQLLASVPSS